MIDTRLCVQLFDPRRSLLFEILDSIHFVLVLLRSFPKIFILLPIRFWYRPRRHWAWVSLISSYLIPPVFIWFKFYSSGNRSAPLVLILIMASSLTPSESFTFILKISDLRLRALFEDSFPKAMTERDETSSTIHLPQWTTTLEHYHKHSPALSSKTEPTITNQ